jgi:hypothetical protein
MVISLDVALIFIVFQTISGYVLRRRASPSGSGSCPIADKSSSTAVNQCKNLTCGVTPSAAYGLRPRPDSNPSLPSGKYKKEIQYDSLINLDPCQAAASKHSTNEIEHNILIDQGHIRAAPSKKHKTSSKKEIQHNNVSIDRKPSPAAPSKKRKKEDRSVTGKDI